MQMSSVLKEDSPRRSVQEPEGQSVRSYPRPVAYYQHHLISGHTKSPELLISLP